MLVHAAASGVGTAALQLARFAGARALAIVGSGEKRARCLQLGAVAACNRHEQGLAEFVEQQTGGQGVDVILDFVGGEQFAVNVDALAMDGRLVLLGLMGGRTSGTLDLAAWLKKRVRVEATTLRNRSDAFKAQLVRDFLDRCGTALADGCLQPVIDRSWSWRNAAEAHRYLEDNRNIGKLILLVD